jgi:excisionase family DNA binding protein
MRLMRVPDVAKTLGVTAWRVYDLARQGVLPPGVVVRLGREVRVDAEALEAWVRAGGAGLEAVRRAERPEPEPRTATGRRRGGGAA